MQTPFHTLPVYQLYSLRYGGSYCDGWDREKNVAIYTTAESLIEQSLNFTDKASYLVWRSDWKQTYKELSKTIRFQKYMRKKKNYESASEEDRLIYDLSGSGLRYIAYFMLEIRHAGKRKSQALRQQSLEKLTLDKTS